MENESNKIARALPQILVANLIPLVGVFFLGWNAYSVFGLYILETIIIGIVHAFKMGIIGSMKVLKPAVHAGNPVESKMGCMIPFFLFHFMFFVFVQTLLTFSAMNLRHASMNPVEFLMTLFQGETGIALATFALFTIMHAANDIRNARNKYKDVSASSLMMEPYVRIIIQQFVVIIGSFAVMLSGRTQMLVIIFICVKGAIEVLLTVRQDIFQFKE